MLRLRLVLHLVLGGLLSLFVLLSPCSARADEAAARQLFKKGIDLYDKRKYDDALSAFRDAYREKPSASIKQNIALSLKGLGKSAEAATAFDEALEEGKGTLKPETQKAIEHELADLSKVVATVNLVVMTDDKKPIDGATVTIEPANEEPRTLPPGASRRPVRLLPGLYTFTAHVPGYPDPPKKKLALVTGPPIDAPFIVGGAGEHGMLTIRPSIADAVVRLNGVEVSHGTFGRSVAAGTYHVEVSSPGWRTTSLDVTIGANEERDLPVTLLAIGDAPPEYYAPSVRRVRVKRAYLVPSIALDTTSYRLGTALLEPAPYGTRRSNFGGASLGVRVGWFFSKAFAVEGLFDIGKESAKYKLQDSDASESETTVINWQIGPMLRFVAPREAKVRFTMATGIGLHGLGVTANLTPASGATTKTGSGLGGSWLTDLGLQIDIDPIFLELALFVDVHGLAGVDEDSSSARLFYASPATRGGARLGVGVPF